MITWAPSINVNIMPPINAYFKAAYGPERMANTPPVTAPATIAFTGSSTCLKCISRQSTELKHPPHIANEPPMYGALFLTCVRPPTILYLMGELYAPACLIS